MDIIRKVEQVCLNETETAILLKAKEIFEDVAQNAETYDLQRAAQNVIDEIDAFFDEEDEFKVCGKADVTQNKITIEITL